MTIVLSGILQKFAQYQREHCIEASTVQEAIEQLGKSHPPLNKALFDPSGALRRTHTVFLNGNQLALEQLAQRVTNKDKLEILTAIAGG